MTLVRTGAKDRTALCRLFGVLLFIVAFPLPSIRIPPDSQPSSLADLSGASAGLHPPSAAGRQPLTLRGTHCAALSLIADLFILKPSGDERRSVPFWLFLAAIGGWTNPLVGAYLVFTSPKRSSRLRDFLSAAIVLCIAATLIVFVTTPIVPLPGFFLWLSGILLIIFPLNKFTSSHAPVASDTPARSDP